MSRLLDDLDKRFKPLVYELLARCTEQRIPVLIVTTGRTREEQVKAVADGVSWTMDSKHLPQPPDGKSLAVDICPYDTYELHGGSTLKWDSTDHIWGRIGAIGLSLGLKWGVTINGVHKDLGHFEYIDHTLPLSHNQPDLKV